MAGQELALLCAWRVVCNRGALSQQLATEMVRAAPPALGHKQVVVQDQLRPRKVGNDTSRLSVATNDTCTLGEIRFGARKLQKANFFQFIGVNTT